MTRITIDLDPTDLAELRRLAVEQARTLDAVVSSMFVRALGPTSVGDPRAEFTWYSQPMHALIDLEDKGAVEAALALDD